MIEILLGAAISIFSFVIGVATTLTVKTQYKEEINKNVKGKTLSS
jgi:hypothetical protein